MCGTSTQDKTCFWKLTSFIRMDKCIDRKGSEWNPMDFNINSLIANFTTYIYMSFSSSEYHVNCVPQFKPLNLQ